MARILKVHPVLGSSDIARSLAFYRGLGFGIVFVESADDPKYAAIERDGICLHLQWNDFAGIADGADRPTYRFVVDDVDGLAAEFAAAITTRMNGPRHTSWGTYEFHLQDPDRNGLQFYVATGDGD